MTTLITIFLKQKPVTIKDICLFLRQLATLIYAGIPIVKSCELLEKCQEKTSVRLLVHHIKRELLSGKTLYDSLRLSSTLFDEFTCQLVRIGEHTGKLDTMLCTIADYQEKSLAFNKKIKQLLFYPCIVLMIALLVSFSMFIFIIPRFATLFEHTTENLPMLTITIFKLSSLLNQHLFALCWIIFILPLLFFYTPVFFKFKSYFFNQITRWPFIHTVIRKTTLARFARNLAITFSAGIPIYEALNLSVHTHHNSEFKNTITTLKTKISTGLSLYHAMATSPYFPILMIQMVKIGEESGMLDMMLDKLANFIETDIDHLIHRLSQLLEPLIMLILGVLIGVLVIGLYLPLFRLGNAF